MTSINSVINDIGMGSFQMLFIAVQAGTRMADLGELTTSASILPGLQLKWGISSYFKACLCSASFMGVFIGSMCSGIWGDKFGRRSGILVSLFGVSLFGICVACCWGPYGLFAARFCLGCCYGFGMSPVLSMCVEISPIMWRGAMLNFSEISCSLGVVVAGALLRVWMPDLDITETYQDIEVWRIVTILTVLPAILAFPFGCRYIYESPIFLAVGGKNKQALEVLHVMASSNGTEDVVRDLHAIDIAIKFTPCEKSVLLQNELVEEKADYWANLSTLARNHTALLFGSMWLCLMGNFLLFGSTYALPQIFRSLSSSRLHPTTEILFTGLAALTGNVISLHLSRDELLGQRYTLSSIAVLTGIMLLFASQLERAPPQSWWFDVALATVFFAVLLESMFLSQTYIFVSEVFPSSCRCTAVAICTAVGRIASMLAPMLFEFSGAHSSDGSHASFFVLQSSLSFLTVAIISTCLSYEMKGQPLQHETCALTAAATGKPGKSELSWDFEKSAQLS